MELRPGAGRGRRGRGQGEVLAALRSEAEALTGERVTGTIQGRTRKSSRRGEERRCVLTYEAQAPHHSPCTSYTPRGSGWESGPHGQVEDVPIRVARLLCNVLYNN